jgi:hypothetical protein
LHITQGYALLYSAYTKNMTTTQLKNSILSYPNCSVRVRDGFINNVHLHVELTYFILMLKNKKGVNMAEDVDCVNIKNRYVEILKAIETGKFDLVGKMEYNNFSNLKKS